MAALQTLRHHRPLFADYVLGLCLIAWGLHVLWFPQRDLTDVPAYHWLTVPAWTAGGAAVVIGALQIASTTMLWIWPRRIAALLAGAIWVNLAVKVFGAQPTATVSAIELALAICDMILFFWLSLFDG